MLEVKEGTTSCTGQSGLAEISQKFQCLINLRVKMPDKLLTIVSGVTPKKGGHFDGDVVACQLRMGKYFNSGHMAVRYQDQIPVLWQLDWRENLANPLRPGCVTTDKNRHVGTQSRSNSLQLRARYIQFPKMVEGQ